ncbi:GFA family protein [Flavisphingomonas formosensis]|uniref:GFA family protein n=1 Tax=Flavisphingomonas formosensis TaxID=861534 RepID=UPI0012FC1C3E|nr:GFA family protein [Sphingomonas formosensis]
MPKITGGCHCGLVHFEAFVPEDVVLLDCNCSICRMTGYLHLIVPETKFRLIEGQRETSTYRFGSGQARHIFCSQCGIKSFYRPRSHPEGISINWRCVDDDHGLDPRIEPFDGRNWDTARATLGS